MRILVDIGHPAHVHFYKHIIWELERRGHEVKITARDKDVTLALLEHYGFPYAVLSAIGSGLSGMAGEFLTREWALVRLMHRWQPDVVTEIGGLFIALICRVLTIKSIAFTDTETVLLDRILTYPFIGKLFTPDCFRNNLKRGQIRYRGYHELAYLHPNVYRPDPSVLKPLGIAPGEPFSILRFVSWQASHDVGHQGLSDTTRHQAIEQLSRYGKVFISSEAPLPPAFEAYRLDLPPHQMHDVLYYASLYLGEGATMATEAGVLGTPAVFISSLAPHLGNFQQLADQFQLVFSFAKPDKALEKSVELLAQPDIKEIWRQRRDQMLKQKVDVCRMVVDAIEKEAR
jgi:predicted glycosyltransferase